MPLLSASSGSDEAADGVIADGVIADGVIADGVIADGFFADGTSRVHAAFALLAAALCRSLRLHFRPRRHCFRCLSFRCPLATAEVPDFPFWGFPARARVVEGLADGLSRVQVRAVNDHDVNGILPVEPLLHFRDDLLVEQRQQGVLGREVKLYAQRAPAFGLWGVTAKMHFAEPLLEKTSCRFTVTLYKASPYLRRSAQ